MHRTTLTLVVIATIPGGSSSYAQQRPLTDAEKKIITSTYESRLKDPLSTQYRLPNLIRPKLTRPTTVFKSTPRTLTVAM